MAPAGAAEMEAMRTAMGRTLAALRRDITATVQRIAQPAPMRSIVSVCAQPGCYCQAVDALILYVIKITIPEGGGRTMVLVYATYPQCQPIDVVPYGRQPNGT
jgi:hypothetical protein